MRSKVQNDKSLKRVDFKRPASKDQNADGSITAKHFLSFAHALN